ncbi:MAG: sensor domain-containing diguanylate cyclase [Fretibacterium sp.]|nr:sensor domain-containing diguanylate cyclase [Fretibacterium sp.]
MYSCELTIQTVGVDSAVVEQMKAIPPLERFSHIFQVFDTFDSLNEVARKSGDRILILGESLGMDAVVRFLERQVPSRKIRNILCVKDFSALPVQTLNRLFDVWGTPLTSASLNFYFRRLQKQLKDEKDFWLCRTWLDQTIDPLPDLIWFKDMKGAHLKVNDAFCNMVNKSKEDIQGRGHYYIWGLTKEEYEKGEFVCLETEREVQRLGRTCVFDEQVKSADGMRQLKTYKTPIFDEDGRIIGTVGVAHDVTLERAYEQQILEMARQDCLTGLATRWYLQEYIEQNRDEKDITCIYFDLDHFKEVNDTYGHQVGDEALAATAELMQQEFSDGFISRLGGDEFMVVLLGKRGIANTESRINAFLARLMDYYWEKPTMRHLSISAGIAQTDPTSAKSIDQLIHESDRALYRAKNAGRACCRIYDPSMETTGRGQR